jgi:MoxR-like ATPase
MEGTYTLPEAQIDRFLMQISVGYPDVRTLSDVLRLTVGSDEPKVRQLLSATDVLEMQDAVRAVPVAPHVLDAVSHFAVSTQSASKEATDEVRRYIRFGPSPRGAQSMVFAAKARALLYGRFNVSFEDLEAILIPTTLHRIQLNFDGESSGVELPALVQKLFARSRAQAK